VRIFAATCTLVIMILYFVAQFVGAGKLVQLLFGIEYSVAVVCAGALTMIYVSIGGTGDDLDSNDQGRDDDFYDYFHVVSDSD
jgi:Na+/pantothenate symporter